MAKRKVRDQRRHGRQDVSGHTVRREPNVSGVLQRQRFNKRSRNQKKWVIKTDSNGQPMLVHPDTYYAE